MALRGWAWIGCALAWAACTGGDEHVPPDGPGPDAPAVDVAEPDGPAVDAPIDALPIDAIDAPIDAPPPPLSVAFVRCRADHSPGQVAAAPDGGFAYTAQRIQTHPLILRLPAIMVHHADGAPAYAWGPTSESFASGLTVLADGSTLAGLCLAPGFCSLAWIAADGTATFTSLGMTDVGPIVTTPPGATVATGTTLRRFGADHAPLAGFGSGGQLALGGAGALQLAAGAGGATVVVLQDATLRRVSAATGAPDPTFAGGAAVVLPAATRRLLAVDGAGAIAIVAIVATPAPHVELLPVDATGALGPAIVTAVPDAIAAARDGDRVALLRPADGSIRVDLALVDLAAATTTPLAPTVCTTCAARPTDLAIAPAGKIYVSFGTTSSACVLAVNP